MNLDIYNKPSDWFEMLLSSIFGAEDLNELNTPAAHSSTPTSINMLILD